MNADGLLTKDSAYEIDELREYAKERNPSIVVVTETHLTDEAHGGTVAIDGYTAHRVDRDQAKAGAEYGGGLVVYLSDGIYAAAETAVTEADMELFSAHLPNVNLHLVAI